MKNIFTYVFTCGIFFSSTQSSAQGQSIALLYPKNTISIPGENATWLIDNYYRWELFLIQNKHKFEVIDEQQLEAGISDDFSLLILPSAKSLSEEQINSIKEFMNDGNSVLSTLSTGVYDSEGNWKGWNSLHQLFGLNFISEIPQQVSSKIHSLFGSTPISADIPPGFRLQVTTYDKPIEVKSQSENTFCAGYWQNSEIPFEGKIKSENTTSIAYGNYGKGKFVWFGFEFSAVVGVSKHQKIADQLLKNSINWLNDELVFQVETWPKGKQCAAVLSCDVEFKFDYINNALDLIEEENLPAHFYILTESIDLPSFKRLINKGDIGLHGDDHELFKYQDYNTQFGRLQKGIGEIEKLTESRPKAFRPPETAYDNVTLHVMAALNVNILSSDFIEDRAVPQFLEDYPQVLNIPKTGFDDYDIFQRLKLTTIVAQAGRYILDFERTYEEGGLYNLNFHTQMQCRKEFVSALKKPIQDIKSKNVWIATHDSIYGWWFKKNKLKINSVKTDMKNYTIEIENTGDVKIEDVVVSFYKKNFIDFYSAKITLDEKSIDFSSDVKLNKVTVPLPHIQPYEKKLIKIIFH